MIVMKHDVFISYSSKNKTAADAICHLLEDNDIKCWMAPRDIPAGTEYGDLIDSAIKEAHVVVLVFSQSAAESQWVKGELNIAFEEQKVIIPYRIDPTPLSGQNRVILNQKHWIDAYPDYQDKFSDLLNAVSLALGRSVNSPTPRPVSIIDHIKSILKSKKLPLTIISVIIVSILAYMLWNRFIAPFKYNNNGIKVSSIRGLSDSQKLVLTEILDNMVPVEAGTFLMGNNPDFIDYQTKMDSLSTNPHLVTLSPFYISRYELTQEQWRAFFNLAGCYLELGDKKAIDNISWEEAMAYADTLSAITGLKFSLPTEAQWEYAAGSAALQRNLPFAGFENGHHHYAWIETDNLSSASEVGKKLPNKLDLYDMTGNVSEWCLDDFASYSPLECQNPFVNTNGTKKIYRGGDFKTPNIFDMKVTSRSYAPSFVKRPATGLRLVINK